MYKEYCTGCGLCNSVKNIPFESDEKGFRKITQETDKDFLKKVCPAGGAQCSSMEKGNIWGKNKGVYLSYSEDKDIRFNSSSGGVLTSIAVYLLDKGLVDGIIQIKQDEKNPIETEIVCSKSREEVKKCSGSRYSSSSPLSKIGEYLGDGKKYAFIGKPCDVTTLRNYLNINEENKKQFPYMLSFFCAGAPSRNANINLLKKLNCTEENCKSLKYRGDGWPGFATAVNKEGVSSQLTYREAWRDTLGRDVRAICRFCLDGIGEMADISCGDAWYLDSENKPIFEESEGRNVVFCRTEAGKKLFLDAAEEGYISKEEYVDYMKELPYTQSYQYERRAAMPAVFSAMKLMGRKTPNYNKGLMKSYAGVLSTKRKWKRFKGTLKRILERKI